MKGLRIIPMFVLFTLLSFLGAVFVEANSDLVSIRFLSYQSEPAKLGLVILMVLTIGMLVSGLFCTIELLALYVQNRRLKRKLSILLLQGGQSSNVTNLPSRRDSKIEPAVASDSSNLDSRS